MELMDLKAVIAAALLGGTVRTIGADTAIPTETQIKAAVKTAQEIWDEVLRQDAE